VVWEELGGTIIPTTFRLRTGGATGKRDRAEGDAFPASALQAWMFITQCPNRGAVAVAAQDQFALGGASVTFFETGN
jgi:hypothetical protein